MLPPPQKKKTGHIKRQKTQSEETEQALEPNTAGMLELLEQEFKITMINILRALMGKVNSIQGQMGNISREREVLRKNQKEC